MRPTLAQPLIGVLLTGHLLLTACAPVAAPAAPTTVPPAPAATTGDDAGLLPASFPPSDLLLSEWRTDFSRRTVEWAEIRSGGPPKDGIPAIDDPSHEDIATGRAWLSDRDPILVVEINGDVRGYPLAILIWHEIVNDTVGGVPVAVTFCPLCNASIVFAREFQGALLDFGTTGLLRNSDLVMYDRQTESWWQQALGQAIVGQYAGERLTFLPAQVVSFADFAAAHPSAQLLARPGAARSYGLNPYVGYDTSSSPFLYDGPPDNRLAATARVVGVQIGDATVAYPFRVVEAVGVINDEVGGTPIAVLHKRGTASALDERTIAESRDVGSSAVFDRRLGARTLTFRAAENGVYVDEETGSTWNLFGVAVAGELAGQRLTPVVAFDHFWFAWAAFFPTTTIYEE